MDQPSLPEIEIDKYEDANSKYSLDAHKRKNQSVLILKVRCICKTDRLSTCVAISLWYSSSILSTVVNKSLISGDEHVFPLTLTFAHVFISSFCDSMPSFVFFEYSHKHGVFPQE